MNGITTASRRLCGGVTMTRKSSTAELERILDLAQKYEAPLGLAVIPQGMDDTLAAKIQSLAQVTVLQHGFSHGNHAPPNEKKVELGSHRPPAVVHRELAAGFEILRDAFGGQFLPVLVPPWNRIATPLLEELAQTGFAGLSTFGPRAEPRQKHESAGLRIVNTHVDFIDWKNHKRFVGAPRAVEAIVTHLKGRRLGHFDSSEPTGLLTHHLVHDEDCRAFLARLLAALDEHPAVKWLNAEAVFGLTRR